VQAESRLLVPPTCSICFGKHRTTLQQKNLKTNIRVPKSASYWLVAEPSPAEKPARAHSKHIAAGAMTIAAKRAVHDVLVWW
jgi:hypothetical protein